MVWVLCRFCRCPKHGQTASAALFRAGPKWPGNALLLCVWGCWPRHGDSLNMSCIVWLFLCCGSEWCSLLAFTWWPWGNIAWACASLQFNPSGWISDLVRAYVLQFGNLEEPSSPQAVANLLWSTLAADVHVVSQPPWAPMRYHIRSFLIWGLAKAFEGGFGDQAMMLS